MIQATTRTVTGDQAAREASHEPAPDAPRGAPSGTAGQAALRARAKRHRVAQQARIVLDSRLIPCEIRDLSVSSAKLRVAPALELPELFELVIAAHDLRTHSARLRWRRGEFAGVTFEAVPAR